MPMFKRGTSYLGLFPWTLSGNSSLPVSPFQGAAQGLFKTLTVVGTNQDDGCEVKVKVAQSSDSFPPHGLYSPWNSPVQNTGVGSLSLLQGIFTTQGSNPGLHCRQILYQLSHKGSPGILEWVAYPFSSGSFDPGIELWSFALQTDSLPAEPQGKPKGLCKNKKCNTMQDDVIICYNFLS